MLLVRADTYPWDRVSLAHARGVRMICALWGRLALRGATHARLVSVLIMSESTFSRVVGPLDVDTDMMSWAGCAGAGVGEPEPVRVVPESG